MFAPVENHALPLFRHVPIYKHVDIGVGTYNAEDGTETPTIGLLLPIEDRDDSDRRYLTIEAALELIEGLQEAVEVANSLQLDSLRN
jgi:hypothetical protein